MHLGFEQIFCACVGLAFLWFAYKWLNKDKVGQAFVFAIIAAGFFFCTLSGVQAFIKTGLIWKVNEKLISYGEKIDNFQSTIADMRDDLRKQQSQLSSNQMAITNVQAQIQGSQQRITDSQFRIDQTQTNLTEQERKLGNVEYWVQNLFAMRVSETVSALDTNRVFIYPRDDHGVTFFVKVQSAPIPNSFEWFTVGVMGIPQRMNPSSLVATANLLKFNLYGFDTNSLKFDLSYVADSRQTNLYSRLPVFGKELWISTNELWSMVAPPL